MPLVFNIGLNRAGTKSLTEALGVLGFRALHHKHGSVRLYDLAIANLRAGRRAFEPIDREHDAFSDFAAHAFLPALDAQYPGAKFILTTRELTAWLDSRERMALANRANRAYRYGFVEVDRELWTRQRADYLAQVEARFRGRPGALLVMDIPRGDNWYPLCSFLELPIPDVPFPRLHGSAPPGATL